MSAKKILVVDDEAHVCRLYREELEDAGYRVATACSGREALELVRTFQPDLVTLDIKMPDMDGIEVLRRLKSLRRDLPVVLCTAYGDYAQDFQVWASDAYIVKSADLTELKETIQRILA